MLETILGIICITLSIMGALAFAFNLAPQAWHAWKTKKTGLTNGFFVLALVGNIGSAAGVVWNNIQTGVWQWQLYGNYFVATFFTVALLVMKIKYKK
jgi:hypothetical protein